MRRDPERHLAFQRRSQASSARSVEESRRRSLRKAADERCSKPAVPFSPFHEECWLAQFDPDHDCEGLVLRCHLLKEQFLRDRLGMDIVERWHPDFWVPGCQGLGPAVGGHHARLDGGKIKLERRDLPAPLERRAQQDERVAVQLEFVYGPLPKVGQAS